MESTSDMSDPKMLTYASGKFTYTPVPEWLKAAEDRQGDWVAALESQGVKQIHRTNYDNRVVDYSAEIYEVPADKDKERYHKDYYVEIWDFEHLIWSALVPETEWPIFHINYILPLVTQSSQREILSELQRLTNAVIAIGSHGAGNPISILTGESLIQTWDGTGRPNKAGED
jgi:hypothetical protein